MTKQNHKTGFLVAGMVFRCGLISCPIGHGGRDFAKACAGNRFAAFQPAFQLVTFCMLNKHLLYAESALAFLQVLCYTFFIGNLLYADGK